MMNLVQMTTNTNRVKNAERKLNLHKAKGQHSSLSIFQVAKLMDVIRMGEDDSQNNQSIFFSLN